MEFLGKESTHTKQSDNQRISQQMYTNENDTPQ